MKRPYTYIPFVSPLYQALKRTFRRWRYSGRDVWCPVCENSFCRWLEGTAHGTCPYCGGECRNRLLCLYLTREFPPGTSPVDVLYIAPDWSMKRWLRRHGGFRCVTTDLAAPGVDFNADLTALPVADGSFDLVLCSHVLEHIPHDARAVEELFRVLRPGGSALVQVPYASAIEHTDEDSSVTDPRERARRFGQFDHVRLYGRDLVVRLSAPGFDVRAVNLTPELGAAEARRLGLWDDTIFVCRKPT